MSSRQIAAYQDFLTSDRVKRVLRTTKNALTSLTVLQKMYGSSPRWTVDRTICCCSTRQSARPSLQTRRTKSQICCRSLMNSLLQGRLWTQKAKRITGFLCLTVSILLFLAMLSHFFYWWMDYDVVQQMQKGSIWSDNGWQVRNFGGRLGAYISYALVRTPLDIHFSGKHLQRGEQLHLRG